MPVNLPNTSASGSNQSVSVDRAERCLITKSLLYANEPIHWLTDPRRRKAEIEKILLDLGIVNDHFDLHGPSNTTNVDCVVHKSLMEYAFIAVTGTSETLKGKWLKKTMINDSVTSTNRGRFHHDISIPQLNNPTFLDPQYELVALHPEHLLPVGTVLTRYDPAERIPKMYVPSPDRRLHRQPGSQLNPFLVILKAASFFRRYYRLPRLPPLPDDVMELMKQTTELSDLIHWKAEIEPGSYAENIELSCPTSQKRDGAKTGRGVMRQSHGGMSDPDWAKRYEESDVETRVEMGEDYLDGFQTELSTKDEEFLEALHSGKLNTKDTIPYARHGRI